MKKSGDDLRFDSTGREVYVNRGIIGISDELEVFQGHDGDLLPWGAEEKPPQLTAIEVEELANHMVHRWEDWRKAQYERLAKEGDGT